MGLVLLLRLPNVIYSTDVVFVCVLSQKRLFVVLGSNNEHSKSECYDRNRAITCTQASQIRKIQREILHPKIDRRNFAESISLIELQSPADISQPNVKPICLPVTPELKTNAKTNLHLAAS